jgi:ATP-dependent Lon protease
MLAARRAKLKTVIMPEANRRDLDDLPKEIREDLTFVFVDHVRQVFDAALLPAKAAAKAARK